MHNHFLINPADAVLHRTQPGYQSLCRVIWSSIFYALANEPATFDTTYIFTDFQSDDGLGTAVCAEYLATAEARRAVLVPILLFCDERTNMQRLVSSDRELHSKLTDVELVTQFRREGMYIVSLAIQIIWNSMCLISRPKGQRKRYVSKGCLSGVVRWRDKG